MGLWHSQVSDREKTPNPESVTNPAKSGATTLQQQNQVSIVNKHYSRCNCQFVISHNSVSFDLMHPIQRPLAIQYLLQNVWIKSNIELIYVNACTTFISSPRIQANLMQFEFIRSHKSLSHTLYLIETAMKSKKNHIVYHNGLRNILDVLISNPLILKYMFQSAHTHKIWQSLMFCINYILSFNIPLLTDHESATKHEWFELYLDFTALIKYWQHNHLLYFLENCFCVFMYNTFAEYQTFIRCKYLDVEMYRDNICDSDSPLFTLWTSFDLHSKIMCRAQKIDNAKGSKLVKLFNQQIEELFAQSIEASTYLTLAAGHNETCDDKFNNNTYCGYPFCDKRKSEFIHKNKCKRCKLIRYCSRKHQKKHWKMIHSQHCQPYY